MWIPSCIYTGTPPSGGDIDPVHARSSSGSKHSVQQPDVNVNIRGETYSAIAIPAENSRVVQEVRLELLAAIEPKQLVNDCEALEGLIRLTYNGIGAAGPKFTELEIEVRRLGSDVKKLCDKSAQVKVRKDILDDLQPVYEYLLDSLEDVAAETLSRVSNVAVQMERASLEMHEDFKQLEKKVVAALERTQRVKGEEALCIVKLQEERAKMEAGLEDARIRRQGGAQSVQEQSEALSEFTRRIGDCRSAEDAADTASKALHVAIQALAKLLAVMMQAGQFWKQMEDHCHSLAESEIQCVIEKVLKLAEQKRLRVWTSDGFKSKVVRYNAQWVAFHYNCTVFVEHMKLSSRAIYQCITEYPTHEESQQILDRLTAQYAMTEMDFR